MSAKPRKGVILAGGTGSRLHPVTLSVNKHLLPVYDKPMIYYPLTTLMLAGIRDITIVSSPDALPQIRDCLGDGGQWGLSLGYKEQQSPDGIAHGLLMAADRIEGHPVTLILGDNIFYRSGLHNPLRQADERTRGATVFAVPVSQPERFGVVVLDKDSRPAELEEKPKAPRSNLAVPGLYFYDDRAFDFARKLKPSARGELEITDLNRVYLAAGELYVEQLGRGIAWLDGGTPEDLFEAGQFVRVLEQRTGLKIACPEEVAYRMDFISRGELERQVSALKPSSYRDYLADIVKNEP
jgi:glucose-1-phosphate thymidylyltransferase